MPDPTHDPSSESWLTPEIYQTLCDIVTRAAEIPLGERRSFVAAACAGDTRLCREALAMLDASEALAEPERDLPAGTRIGAYRVERELGKGGMGAVYLASRADDSFEQHVAIKVIRCGIGGDDVLARFALERQILASLEHPNIARLVDGGAMPDGRPYLVMEYVDGVPITVYADRRRLSIRERIALFRTVCDAVEHAHQKLVVHRDLKPSNVLVNAAGAPKLLDFGVAKLLTTGGMEAARLTLPNLTPGTPLYASPEQFAGDLVTTTTDVYALGIVLFELLTGHWPFPPAGDPMTRRALSPSVSVAPAATPTDAPGAAGAGLSPKATAAARGSTPGELERQLRGDLDAIVLKALADVHERYRSVSELSDDLQRHLDGFPVLARTGTMTYRAAKFAGRHRAALVATALLVSTLVGGIASTYYQWQRAEAERQRAQRRFDSVRSLAGSVMDVSGAIAGAGADSAQEALVLTSLRYLEQVETEAANDPALLDEISAGYRRVGDVQRARAGSTGAAAALKSYRRALHVSEQVVTARPEDVNARRGLAASYERVGTLLSNNGDNRAADENLAQSLKLYQEVLKADRANVSAQRDLMLAHLRYADNVAPMDRGAAQASFEQARQIAEALVQRDPENVQARRDLVVMTDRLRGFDASADSAAARDEEARYFEGVKDTQEPDRLEYFLQRYPDGPHAAEARFRLDALRSGRSRRPTGRAAGRQQGVSGEPAGQPPVPAAIPPTLAAFHVEWSNIPAGRFEMGCDLRPDRVCRTEERPRHWVVLTRSFAMTRTEVTLAQYRAYAQATGRKVPQQPAWNADARFPVVNITWDDARLFCQAAGGRLPTEAEWEWAASGGHADVLYPWGDAFERTRANAGFPGRDGWETTSPVGTFPPNAYGLFDMAGNVWEWVADWYDPQYYQRAPETDPPGPASGPSRVLRGGSYSTSPTFLRITQRGEASMDRRRDATGIRCAR